MLKHTAVFTFMTIVTSCVVALFLTELAKGARAPAAIAVYGVTAWFGMRFLAAAWPSLLSDGRRLG